MFNVLSKVRAFQRDNPDATRDEAFASISEELTANPRLNPALTALLLQLLMTLLEKYFPS